MYSSQEHDNFLLTDQLISLLHPYLLINLTSQVRLTNSTHSFPYLFSRPADFNSYLFLSSASILGPVNVLCFIYFLQNCLFIHFLLVILFCSFFLFSSFAISSFPLTFHSFPFFPKSPFSLPFLLNSPTHYHAFPNLSSLFHSFLSLLSVQFCISPILC